MCVFWMAIAAWGQELEPEPDAKPGEVTDWPVFKPGKGLTFESADEQFALAMRLRAQFLYSYVVDPEEDAALHGMQIRRARLQFGGHVFGEHNKYKAEFAFSPRDEGFDGGPTTTPLLDWYAEFDHLPALNLRVGQYKVPFSRQRVVSSGDLQLVDRSIAQGEFNLDRDIGMHVFSKDLGGLGLFRYYAGVWFNEGRDAHDPEPFHPMLIGRLEVLPFGDFEDYSEVDLDRTEKPGLSLGAAYAFLDDAENERGILGDPFADAGTADLHVYTADFVFKWAGLSVTGELFVRDGNRDGGDAVDDLGQVIPVVPVASGTGWFVQGGYLIPPAPVEFAARYSEITPTAARSPLEAAHELGGGVSWYPGEHSLKLQADYFRLWGADGPAEGVDQVRAQLQLAY